MANSFVPGFDVRAEKRRRILGSLLDVAAEVVEDRLPAAALQFERVLRLGIEDRGHLGRGADSLERRAGSTAVAYQDRNRMVRLDLLVDGFEIEAEALVPGLHPGLVGTTHFQIDDGTRTAPVVIREVPTSDFCRRREGLPRALDRGG